MTALDGGKIGLLPTRPWPAGRLCTDSETLCLTSASISLSLSPLPPSLPPSFLPSPPSLPLSLPTPIVTLPMSQSNRSRPDLTGPGVGDMNHRRQDRAAPGQAGSQEGYDVGGVEHCAAVRYRLKSIDLILLGS